MRVCCRARRRKKLAKALERQARKLRAKGIAVDVESLRTEYLTQHRVASESDLDDDDIQIDVVGEDSDDEGCGPEDCSLRRSGEEEAEEDARVVAQSTRLPPPKLEMGGMTSNVVRNPFSIESLLYKHT